MKLARTKSENLIDVSLEHSDRWGRIRVSIADGHFERDYRGAGISLTKKEVTQLIKILKAARDRKGAT